MPKTTRRILLLILSFLAGVLAEYLTPKLVAFVLRPVIFRETRKEVVRASSPDGTVDAIMTVADCGVPCSFAYAVYVVPKGQAAPEPKALPKEVFSAENLVEGKLVWTQSRLLQISYKKALIDDFRNVAYPFGKIGDEASWRYSVEIRLSPTTPGFSYLQEDQQK